VADDELKMWWFKRGSEPGLRSEKEQLIGLDAIRPFMPRASVLDLGTAEGCLLKFYVDTLGVDLGHGVEIVSDRVEKAKEICKGYINLDFFCADLNKRHKIDRFALPEYDVVLALAILHKLEQPIETLQWAARKARRAIAIRLPGREQTFTDRRSGNVLVDPVAILPDFKLISAQPGPRAEMTMIFARE
jgi:hypothetical protein